MSILPITLKLGLCNIRSNCNGVKVNGDWTPEFPPRLLYKSFTKSALDPPQQMIVASPEFALNSRDIKSTKFFAGGTSLPQCTMGIHRNCLPSQNPTLEVLRRESTENSIEYAPSRAMTADTCFTSSTNR